MRNVLLLGLSLLLTCLIFPPLSGQAPAVPSTPSFDRLADADRKTLQERFTREVWPLLERGGKNGCVGCHSVRGGALRFSGDPAQDFPRLLRDGFFLPDDDGSLLGRIIDPAPQRRMPPGKLAPWTPEEIGKMRNFTAEVERRQRK